MSRLRSRRDDATRHRAQARVPIELAADALQRLQSIAQSRRVLEAMRVRQLHEATSHTRQGTRRLLELVRLQRAGRHLRSAARA
jgi:hypothetical protein